MLSYRKGSIKSQIYQNINVKRGSLQKVKNNMKRSPPLYHHQ